MKKLILSSVGLALLIYLLDYMTASVALGAEHYLAGLLSVLLLNIVTPHLD